MVGHCVVAMGTVLGCTTVNIMRERRMEADMIERIKYQGGQGTVCVTDVYAQKPNFARLMQDLPRPKLALNCVGGESARTLFKWLG
jgi:trans-2-enoyl-CoA reductase